MYYLFIYLFICVISNLNVKPTRDTIFLFIKNDYLFHYLKLLIKSVKLLHVIKSAHIINFNDRHLE